MMMRALSNATDRLWELERTVSVLNGQLREMQSELQHTKASTMRERLWGHWLMPRQNRVYMSAVCNRRVRPNTKVTHHVSGTSQ
jgi:hypothetical protein